MKKHGCITMGLCVVRHPSKNGSNQNGLLYSYVYTNGCAQTHLVQAQMGVIKQLPSKLHAPFQLE